MAPCLWHIERAYNPKFYAPTKASKKLGVLAVVAIILPLSIFSKSVGHY